MMKSPSDSSFAGYTCCPIDMRVLSAIHIPHNDEVRISNFEGYAKDREFLDVFEKRQDSGTKIALMK